MVDISKAPRDMSRAEILALIRQTVQDELAHQGYTPAQQNADGLLAMKPLSVGAWTGKPDFIKREDFYDDSTG